MRKQQFIDLTIHACAGGDAPPELLAIYHPKIVEYQIEQAIESLFNPDQESLQSEIGLPNWKYDFFTKPYLLPVEFDSVRNKYYSNIPVSLTSINNNSAVRMIYPVQSEESAFLPRAQTDNFLMGELDVSRFMNIVKFTVESNQKIYYTGNNDLLKMIHCKGENVMAKLAVKFSELEDTDEINIPDGKNGAIFQYVMSAMMQTKPEDTANENTPSQINNA